MPWPEFHFHADMCEMQELMQGDAVLPTPLSLTAMDAQLQPKRQPQLHPHLRTIAPFLQCCSKASTASGDPRPSVLLGKPSTPRFCYENPGLSESQLGDRMAGKMPFESGSQPNEKMSRCTTSGRHCGSSSSSTVASSIFFLPASLCTALELLS